MGVAASILEKRQIEDEIPEDAEIWVVNESHRHMGSRKPSRVFQMHVRDWRESERIYLGRGSLPEGLDHDCFGRNNEHVEYLRTCGVPVYTQRPWEDIPTAVVYPFEAVREEVGIPLPPLGNKRLWATSSFGYMAALLLTEHLAAIQRGRPVEIDNIDTVWELDGIESVSEVFLYGVELPLGTHREQQWEWPNLAYYLGLMAGLGIKVTLPSCGSALLSAPHYALDGHPYVREPDHWWVPGQAAVVYGRDDVWRLGDPYGADVATFDEILRARAQVEA